MLEEYIAEAVRLYGVTPDAILGPSRFQCDVTPRRYVMRRLRRDGWSTGEIGRAFNRHHTSVLHLTQGYEYPEPVRIERPAHVIAVAPVVIDSDPIERADRQHRLYLKKYRQNCISGSAALRDGCLALMARRNPAVGS